MTANLMWVTWGLLGEMFLRGLSGEMFPDMTDEQLAYLYNLSGSTLLSVVDCMH